jgi:hypothetical protein
VLDEDDRADLAAMSGNSSDHLVLNARLQLASPGRGATIDAGGQSRIFWLSHYSALELQNVHLRRGHADFGGAVYAMARSNITMDGCTVQECTCLSDHTNGASSFGPAVYIKGGGQLTMASTHVSECHCER